MCGGASGHGPNATCVGHACPGLLLCCRGLYHVIVSSCAWQRSEPFSDPVDFKCREFYRHGKPLKNIVRHTQTLPRWCHAFLTLQVNVANIDLSTKLMGYDTSFPVYITATALGKLAHPEGEVCACIDASVRLSWQLLVLEPPFKYCAALQDEEQTGQIRPHV